MAVLAQQGLGSHGVEPRVGGGGDGFPCFYHFGKGWRCRGCAVTEFVLDFGEQNLVLSEREKVTLFLPREMPHIPTDAVHWQDTLARILVRETFERALKFTSGET